MGNLYSHIVFQPPDPPLYTDEGGTFSFNYKKSVESLLNPFNEDKIIEHPLIYIKTSRDNMIACAFFPHRDATHTILFSHGNGEDMGSLASYAVDLSTYLGVNVFIYDYSGYGMSEGKTSELNCYADIRAAYSYLICEKRLDPCQIILFGRSLGSGPTIDIAASLGRECGGVVLISGLTSCLRVGLRNVNKTSKFDMFSNIDKINNVLVPVFIVHGTLDNVIHIDHGRELCQKAKYPLLPLWVQDAGHNNLEGPRFQRLVFERYSEVIKEFEKWKHG